MRRRRPGGCRRRGSRFPKGGRTVSDTAALIPPVATEVLGQRDATVQADDAVYRRGRRHFTLAALVALGGVAPPSLWVLWASGRIRRIPSGVPRPTISTTSKLVPCFMAS